MQRLVTADRPTGRLHLGHYVGSIQNRVRLQERYECYLFVADLHMLTTKHDKEDILASRDHIREMLLDWLSCGIDPARTTIYLQSSIPAIYELNLFCEMLVDVNRLHGLPSIKEMARNAKLDIETMPFGLLGYPVLQTADILLPRASIVPVGKDNAAHVELARDVARRFNALYGELFPVPDLLLSDVPTLVGTDNMGKMSKSAGNCIFLSDDAAAVDKKVRAMYTDPARIHANVPGTVEGNPVFTYLDIFCSDRATVDALKARYREGAVGDVEVKSLLASSINAFLDPIRERRKHLELERGYVEEVLYDGTRKMAEMGDRLIREVKSQMGLGGTWNKISRIARERKEAFAKQLPEAL